MGPNHSLTAHDRELVSVLEVKIKPGDRDCSPSENGLKMNSNKTHCISFAAPNFNKRTEAFQITIDYTVRHMEDKVKSLGVIFDSRFLLSITSKHRASG